MNWREYEAELPGFAAVEEGGWRILARRGYEAWAREMVTGKAKTMLLVHGGRALHPVMELGDGGGAVVRRFHRGGLIRRVNRDRYFLGHRAFEELRVMEAARAAGVSVPDALAAAERRRGIGYEALIATRWIEGVMGIDQWLGEREEDEPLDPLRLAGEQIRRMHDAGIAHPDLNLRNLLVGPGAATAPTSLYLVDFDRARLGSGPVAASRRAADLNRLARSARKLGLPLGGVPAAALREGYGPAWPPGADLP